MNLWDIAKKVGVGVLSAAVPGAGPLIATVNAFLPDDKKLPEDATGAQLESRLNSLPAADRAALMEKEFDVEIIGLQEGHATLRAMLESDAKNPHTTRPYVVKHSFHVLAVVTVGIIFILGLAVVRKDEPTVDALVGGWPFIASLLAPFIWLLKSYFGTLSTEHRDRLDAASGQEKRPAGLVGALSAVMNRGR